MPLDPARIIFATKLRPVSLLDEDDDPCDGCLFRKERSEVCHKAAEQAKLRGLEDCEAGFVYIAVKIDPRQVDLFE
jgi:hypothetical protein